MKKEIYKLKMNTQNYSANKTGYFETMEEVEKVIKKWEEIVKNDKGEYYGETTFETTKVYLGEEYFD